MANAWQGSGAKSGTSEGAGVGIAMVVRLKRITRTGAGLDPGVFVMLADPAAALASAPASGTACVSPASVAVWMAARRFNSSCCPASQCSIAWSMASCCWRSATLGLA
ncbi:MAG: hypothetical protein AAGB26_07245 [Planctomycetota bacterium]